MIRDIIDFVQTRAIWLVIGILAFSVLSSKQIIIYNEEILVALNFFAFVWFTAHYYGQQIQDALDERGNQVAQGLQNYVKAKSEFLQLCKQEYEKQLYFAVQIRHLGVFSKQEMVQAAIHGELRLHQAVPALVLPKLQYLASSQLAIQQELQQQVALHLCTRILENYRSASSTIRNSLVVQSIRRLENLKNV